MSRVLLSFSGHKLSDKALEALRLEFEEIEEIFIPLIDFEQDMEEQLSKLINQVTCQLDGSKNITIVVPGHSNLSAILYNFLFGIIGHPPDIYMFREVEDGNYMPFKRFKGRDLKKAGRLLREKYFNNLNSLKNNKNVS